MLSEEISHRIFHAFIRPHFQLLLNIFPILSNTKQQLEAYNRKIHRSILGWHDASNDEITSVPGYKSIATLTKLHFNKILIKIEHINPSIINDYLQHKMHLMYLREYFLNPRLC